MWFWFGNNGDGVGFVWGGLDAKRDDGELWENVGIKKTKKGEREEGEDRDRDEVKRRDKYLEENHHPSLGNHQPRSLEGRQEKTLSLSIRLWLREEESNNFARFFFLL